MQPKGCETAYARQLMQASLHSLNRSFITRNVSNIIIMVDLKNPKWEDFHIIDAQQRDMKPLTAERIARNLKIQRVHQMARAISRARKQAGYTSTKPESKVIRFEDMPKELFDKFFGKV